MEEKLTRDEWIAGAALITICVVIGIIIGMALMYGWLAINGEIKALEKTAEVFLLMAA